MPNRITVEVKALAARVIHDPAYQENLLGRIRAGEANHIETLLWHYLYGKPVERVALEGEGHGLIVMFRNRPEGYDPVRDGPVTLAEDERPRPALPPNRDG